MVSIERFYSNSSSFDHEVTRTLGAAFDRACALVGHTPSRPPLAKLSRRPLSRPRHRASAICIVYGTRDWLLLVMPAG
jgi:hypothetical protein